MTADEAKIYYWNYYLSLEKQVMELERVVEFDLKINGNTYSARFLELLQSICSEIDVIGKILARQTDSNFDTDKNSSIFKWWYIIQSNYSIQTEPIYFRNETLFPWDGFFVKKEDKKLKMDESSKMPVWWNSYNNVKHHRTDFDGDGLMNYTQANLFNVINALSALYILEVLLMEKVKAVVENGDMFSCKGHRIFIVSFGGVGE